MITITGWVRYTCGEVLLTFKDPEIFDFDNAWVLADADEYQEGDIRTYLKTITADSISPSFWDYFTTDELDTLMGEEYDISFEMSMRDGDVRTIMKSREKFMQAESEDNEDEIKNNEQIASKQKTETVYSSIASLI
jgi:hypothetical protein